MTGCLGPYILSKSKYYLEIIEMLNMLNEIMITLEHKSSLSNNIDV